MKTLVAVSVAAAAFALSAMSASATARNLDLVTATTPAIGTGAVTLAGGKHRRNRGHAVRGGAIGSQSDLARGFRAKNSGTSGATTRGITSNLDIWKSRKARVTGGAEPTYGRPKPLRWNFLNGWPSK